METALHPGLDIQGTLFDNWFASKEFIKFLRGKGLRWVTRLKSDRKIKIKGRYEAIGQFAETLLRESFRKVSIGNRIYHVFSKAVDLKGVGQAGILIGYENEEFSGSPAYFATDQIRWEGARILKTYSMLWNIETFFRDSKQNLGLEDYQLRDSRYQTSLVSDLPGLSLQMAGKCAELMSGMRRAQGRKAPGKKGNPALQTRRLSIRLPSELVEAVEKLGGKRGQHMEKALRIYLDAVKQERSDLSSTVKNVNTNGIGMLTWANKSLALQ